MKQRTKGSVVDRSYGVWKETVSVSCSFNKRSGGMRLWLWRCTGPGWRAEVHQWSFCLSHCLLKSVLLFGGWAEPAGDGGAQGRPELDQQLLWEIYLPQLSQEDHPLQNLFEGKRCAVLPPQFFCDGGLKEVSTVSTVLNESMLFWLHHLVNPPSVSRLITVLNGADHSCAICKAQEIIVLSM